MKVKRGGSWVARHHLAIAAPHMNQAESRLPTLAKVREPSDISYSPLKYHAARLCYSVLLQPSTARSVEWPA